MELFYDDPRVAVPILKLFVCASLSSRSFTHHVQCELVQNKNNRLNFGVSSAHGILLFREARFGWCGVPVGLSACSKLIMTYGSRMLSLSIPSDSDAVYLHKYKGITVCYNILRSVRPSVCVGAHAADMR
jgi:hypothetical protein